MLGKKSIQGMCVIVEMYFFINLKVKSEKMQSLGFILSPLLLLLLPLLLNFNLLFLFFVCLFICLKLKSSLFTLGKSINLPDYFASVSNIDFGSVILYSACINKQMLNIANQTQMLQIEHSSTTYAAQSSNSLMSASILSSYSISLFPLTCSLEDTASSTVST